MARVLVVVMLCGVSCAEERSGGWDAGPSKANGGGGGGDLVAACERYVAAITECMNEVFGDSTAGTSGMDGVCDAYDGLGGPEASEARAYLDCLADLYESADCSTVEAYNALISRAQECLE
ncbi:MAG: hypothetical protein ACI8PZ_000488 [Myxococcota bacterium]|jgi:hypothetical protein